MAKKKQKSSKPQKDMLTREYLHSISRIGDRLKMLKRDMTKQKKELEYMEEDVQLLSDAFESLFNDLMKRLSKKFNKEDELDVEKI